MMKKLRSPTLGFRERKYAIFRHPCVVVSERQSCIVTAQSQSNTLQNKVARKEQWSWDMESTSKGIDKNRSDAGSNSKRDCSGPSRNLSFDWGCSLELSVQDFEQFSESIRVCAASTYRSAVLVLTIRVVVLDEQLDGFAELFVRCGQLGVRAFKLGVLFIEHGQLSFQVPCVLFFALAESSLSRAILSSSTTGGCVCSLSRGRCGHASKGWLDMLQRSRTAVGAVMVGSEIRWSHWHGVGSKLHGLVDDLGIVGMLYLGGKLVVCGRDWRSAETGNFGQLRRHVKYGGLMGWSNVVALSHPVVE